MDYSQKIHDLADGSLAPELEDEVFHAMSSNEECRSELKQQLALKNAIRKDRVAFIPPAQSTMKVFSALGFSAVGVLTGGAAAAGFGSRVMSFLGQYAPAIVTGIATAITTALVTYMAVKAPDKPITPIISQNTVQTPIPKVGDNKNNIPTLSSSEVKDVTPKIRTIIRYKYIYVDREPTQQVAIAKTDSIIDIPESIALAEDNYYSGATAFSQKLHTDPFNRIPISYSGDVDLLMNRVIPQELIGIGIEYRGVQSYFNQTPTVAPSEYGRFSNSGVSLYYQLSKSFHIGADIRQETFFQKFDGIDNNNRKYRIEQQPNFTSYGLVLRWVPAFLYWKGFNPMAQTSFGANKAGLINRDMIGFTYSPYQSVSFVVGAEYSILRFKHQNKAFYNNKFGLNYGVMVLF